MKRRVFYMALGAGIVLTYMIYEKELISICNKMLKSKKSVLED